MAGAKQHARDIELWPYAKKEWIKVFDYYINTLGYSTKHFSINKLAGERERAAIQESQDDDGSG